MRIITIITLIISSQCLHAQFEENFKPQTKEPMTVRDYMSAEQVPGFSFFADFGNGTDTSVLIGHRGDASHSPVILQTRFQAGSMAAAAVCLAVLHLVDQGVVELDAPVNTYLPSPVLDKRKKPDGPVTVRDLLIYRRDFDMAQKPKGYPAGYSLPTLQEVLTGSGSARNKPIAVKGNLNASENSQYGNILYLQQLLEHHYKKPLTEIVRTTILDPLGMTDTEYTAELNGEAQQLSAIGHDDNGEPIEGGYRRYPETGIAGMWTTPRDYCKLVRHVMDAANGLDNSIISVELAEMGLKQQFIHRSLIFNVNGDGKVYWGGNGKGFFMSMQAWVKEGIIAVAACNKNLQWRLVNPSLWQTYDWAKKHLGKTE